MLNSDKPKTAMFVKYLVKGRLSRVLPFFVAAFFTICSASAQIHEIGIGLGGSNYVGDLMPTYTYENYRLAGEGFYRYNFTEAITFRGNLWIGKLVGEDNTNYDYLNETRNRRAFTLTAFEFDALVEYNFFNFRDESGLIRWSPYFLGGVGVMYNNAYRSYSEGTDSQEAYLRGEKTAEFSNFQPVIPFGLGVKYAITPQWAVGAEWIAHKTFTDYIDNTGALNEDNLYATNPYQFGNDKHKDWYFFTGITLSYTIWTIPCPFDYE